jgi:hypothetical protein
MKATQHRTTGKTERPPTCAEFGQDVDRLAENKSPEWPIRRSTAMTTGNVVSCETHSAERQSPRCLASCDAQIELGLHYSTTACDRLLMQNRCHSASCNETRCQSPAFQRINAREHYIHPYRCFAFAGVPKFPGNHTFNRDRGSSPRVQRWSVGRRNLHRRSRQARAGGHVSRWKSRRTITSELFPGNLGTRMQRQP